MMLSEDRKACLTAAITRPHANDSRDVWERLNDFAQRGVEDPALLAHHELQQVCFALLLLIASNQKE